MLRRRDLLLERPPWTPGAQAGAYTTSLFSVLFVHVRLIRKAVHGQPARTEASLAAVAGQMPRLPRDVDDVAFLRFELGQPFDVVADRAEHDQPELPAFFVKVSFVPRLRRLVVPHDDVGEAPIVSDEG